MKRFLPHEELARDRRFKRQQNRNQLLASLPDDVDAVVRVLETVGPKLRERVRGTVLEQAYDELGPGFQFLANLAPNQPGTPGDLLQLRMRFHGIFVGEVQALEAAGRTLWDFPDAPWEFKLNMARQCWDEARHVQIYEKLLTHVGGRPGMFPESTFLFECACSDDPALRVAGVNRGLEGLACDVFRDMIRYAEAIGDETMRQAVDYVLADELTHVRFGSEWVKEFTRDDPERFQRAQAFRKQVDKQFSFGGARSDREDAAIPIAYEDRREAGFTEVELRELSQLSGEGPRKETLLAAARILRERHLARRAARKSGEAAA
jgi:uncharacterized ferritin-like protein (DUF455 family)